LGKVSTTTIGKRSNYNGWEKNSIITTTIGISTVGGGYNGWEMARWILSKGIYIFD
jgi:hypothetical protein